MWPVYLINLSENRNRLANCDHQFVRVGIPYHRIEAVNGWKLTQEEIARVYDEAANRRRARHPLVKPQIGLHLSHIRVWERIASGTAPGGFIFEDDFIANPSLASTLELLTADDGDWDMIKLFSPKPASFPLSRRPLGACHEIVVPYRVPITNVAYGLTRTAAEKLVTIAIPFFRPCDEHHKYFWERNMKISLVRPSPVRIGEEHAQTGTVSGSRRKSHQYRGWALVRQIIRNVSVQLHYQALLHYYRTTKRWR